MIGTPSALLVTAATVPASADFTSDPGAAFMLMPSLRPLEYSRMMDPFTGNNIRATSEAAVRSPTSMEAAAVSSDKSGSGRWQWSGRTGRCRRGRAGSRLWRGVFGLCGGGRLHRDRDQQKTALRGSQNRNRGHSTRPVISQEPDRGAKWYRRVSPRSTLWRTGSFPVLAGSAVPEAGGKAATRTSPLFVSGARSIAFPANAPISTLPVEWGHRFVRLSKGLVRPRGLAGR